MLRGQPELRSVLLRRNGFTRFLVLGAVILVVVGEGALRGHGPLRASSHPHRLVRHRLPSLLLVYFGQGALLLDDPGAIDNPFYRLAPRWALYPLVVRDGHGDRLRLMRGVFAHPPSGAARYSPRVTVDPHIRDQEGQIYVRSINGSSCWHVSGQ